jgi:hypothetical protein
VQGHIAGHIHEQLQVLSNMAILKTKVNPIMANKTRNFEQKVAKIAKAGAANTPFPHDNYGIQLHSICAAGKTISRLAGSRLLIRFR